jgi:hypothetical protein
MPDDVDPFVEFAAEFADGERWKVLRAEGWEDLQEKLAEVVGDLPVRRRQALMMLLFALVEDLVTSAEVRAWIDGHDVTSDDGIEAMIAWLRDLRRSASG